MMHDAKYFGVVPRALQKAKPVTEVKMSIVRYLMLSGCLLLTACSDFQPAKSASVGGYELQLKTNPSPLTVGKAATISFSIRDDHNQPAADCKVGFRQFMPEHEMTLDNTFVEMIDKAKIGKYSARSSEFRMGGDWVVEFKFTCGAESYTTAFEYHLEWPK